MLLVLKDVLLTSKSELFHSSSLSVLDANDKEGDFRDDDCYGKDEPYDS